MDKKRILLKISGEVFLDSSRKNLSADTINKLIGQLKQLNNSHQFGIVVGGGNFFRGKQHGKQMGLNPAVGHQIGMLVTVMNGLILKNLLEQHNIPAKLFCAIPSPTIGTPICQQTIHNALHENKTLIFTGGTGNPFFTTDTNAILRALQMNADEIWKGTTIDGVYTTDPRTDKDAQLLKTVTFIDAINQHLGIMDLTAYAMAEQHKQRIRIFDIFAQDALLHVAQDPQFGSTIV